MRDVGTTYTTITLARTLAEHANVVLVDFAFGAPNLSVVSNEPDSPGVADLVRGAASFGDIITRDQYSNVHLIATGDVGNDAADHFAPLAQRAVLVGTDPADPVTQAAHQRMMMAGFADVAVLAGGTQVAAA